MDRQPVVGMGFHAVKALPSLDIRVDVDCDPTDVGDMVQEIMVDLLGDIMCLRDAQSWIHCDVEFHLEPVTAPPSAHISDLMDPWDMARQVSDGFQDLRLHPVQHPREDRQR
jgi:hypothetical protein